MRDKLLTLDRISILRSGRYVVQEFDLTLERGEIVLLLGHNGSGKSSLLQALAGTIPIADGSIDFARHDCSVATLLQDANIFLSLSVGENIAIGALGAFKPPRRAMLALRKTVEHSFPELGNRWTMSSGFLSGGIRQLVGIVRSLSTDAGLYLLDEPLNGLSPELVDRVLLFIKSRIQAQESAAIIVEHNADIMASIATRLCVMKDGKLVYDGSLRLLGDRVNLRKIYL